MPSQHVLHDLVAHANGELDAERSRVVAEHVTACRRCREALDDVVLTMSVLKSAPRVAAPDSMWPAVSAEIERPRVAAAPTVRWRRLIAAGVVLAAAGLAIALRQRAASSFDWRVAVVAGVPRVASQALVASRRVAVGEWIETDATSRALVEAVGLGHVEIDPDTRVRLVASRPTEQRLDLQRGTVRARIVAPPRLFVIGTPSAEAVDLGCAYTLTIADDGSGLLRVTSGWVSLEDEPTAAPAGAPSSSRFRAPPHPLRHGRNAIVPAGAACETRLGVGPGTPCFEDASPSLKTALRRYDFEGGASAALSEALAAARPRDTLTLWHLLRRAAASERGTVVDRLAMLSPLPSGVTRDGLLSLDSRQLVTLRKQLEASW